MKIFDTAVIGAGQAGLAAGYFLQKEDLDFCILERHKVGGSWNEYYDNLQLFTPAEYSSLPGLPFPGNQKRYPAREEMAQYLKMYTKKVKLPVETGVKVRTVEKKDELFDVKTSNGTYRARSVIVAAGPFNEPYTPNIPGMDNYIGTLLHTYHYKNPEQYKGKRVVVVGGGASAVQIAVELAEVANVTLARRNPVKFVPRNILGKDITWWGRYTIDLFKVPMKTSVVIDEGKYKRALEEKHPPQREMFQSFYKEGVIWQNGAKEPVDVVIFGTGYRPQFTFLPDGIHTKESGLFYLGLPNLRNYASATVRGAGRDAKEVVKKLAQFLKSDTVGAAR